MDKNTDIEFIINIVNLLKKLLKQSKTKESKKEIEEKLKLLFEDYPEAFL